MNRLRFVGILSAMLGSTAGFLVLSRWRLAGTITGAAMMPLIYTLVSHCSHASYEGLHKWARCRFRNKASLAVLDLAVQDATQSATPPEENHTGKPVPRVRPRPANRVLQWSMLTLAFLAFVLSVYSIAHSEPASTTILREKVIETVTVTEIRSAQSMAQSDAASASATQAGATTTTAVSQGTSDTTATTVPAGQSTTTTLP